MLAAIQAEVHDGLNYLQGKNVHFTAVFFERSFEHATTCNVATTVDSPEVIDLLEYRRPCLMLIECDVQGFAPRQELYLPELQLLGTRTEIDEDEDSCKLEISAVGLTKNANRQR